MSFINKIFGGFSHRGSALSRYRAGMAHAKAGRFQDAIDDYSKAIAADNIPADVRAMALFNRSLAYSSLGDDPLAADDLTTILGMRVLPENIRTQAMQRRERIRKREARVTDANH